MNNYFKQIYTILFGLISLYGNSQWVANTSVNTLVAPQQTEDLKTVTSSDGSTFVAFWHQVPAPQYYEMRLQKLDTNGSPLLGVNGMLVNGGIPMSSYIVTWDFVIDDSNNVYIGMTGTGSGNPAIVHKITPTGTQVWGASGVNVGSGYDVKILPLSNGQVIVSQYSGVTSSFRKYSATGSPMWTAPITINPVNAGSRTIAGEMAEISGNKFEVIYYEQAGFSPYGLPYVQCYGFGSVAQWSTPLALTSGVYVQTNRRYATCTINDTVYIGFAGSIGTNIQSYIQRINPNGTKPWGANGIDFATQSTNYERDVRIAYEEGSQFIWAIAEFTQSTQANVGEYVQKIDKTTGAKLLGANAQMVFPIGALDRSHRGELRLHYGRPVFLVSDGNSNGVFPKDILLIHLDTNGILDPTTGLIPMATNPNGVKNRIAISPFTGNHVVTVWCENRTGNYLPYAQRHSIIPCFAPVQAIFPFANGLSVSISVNASAADSVYWSFGDGNFSTDTSTTVNHTYSTPGTYTVCRYAYNACGADTACQNITVCNPLSAQFSYTSFVDSVYFMGNSNPGDSLYWDFGDGTQVSSTTSNTTAHVYAANGSYTVTLVAFNACGSDTTQQIISIFGIDIAENKAIDKVIIWPNPARDIIYVQIPSPLIIESGSIMIYTINGRCLASYPLIDPKPGQVRYISVDEIPAGIYLLKTPWDEEPQRITIIK